MEKAENFIFFATRSKELALMRKVKPTAVDSWAGGISYNGRTFDEAIADTLSKVKIFEIDDTKKRLLAMTDTPKNNEEYIRLPFNEIFLDVSFTKDELKHLAGIETKYAKEIKGIAVTKGNFVLKVDDDLVQSLEDFKSRNSVGNGLRMTVCSILDAENRDYVEFDVFNRNVDISDEEMEQITGHKMNNIEVIESPGSDPNLRNFVHKFVLNFLNFLHNPEVEYIEHQRSEKNIQRKLKAGKVVVPSTMMIKVTGKLQIYLDDMENNQGVWEYSHRFWCRGHFRNLQADRYIEKKRIFILPFIKGRGLLIEKDYEVK